MILKNISIEKFADYVITDNKKIIIFGAGTLLKSWVAYILEIHGLTEAVNQIVDNDPGKWGNQISINGSEFIIDNPKNICKETTKDKVILITSSYFSAIITQLDDMQDLDIVECYVAPIMHITYQKKMKHDTTQWKSNEPQIPKVIHYCWFGRKPIPERNQLYMESWKKYCPDYEIIRWDEDTYDISKNKYMKQAYESGKYGYVPDYARIDILLNYGGIYLDTDVELIQSLDDLLYLDAFTGFEEYPTVNFGGGSGCKKGFSLLESILEFREDIDFINSDGKINQDTCGYYESIPLVKKGLRLDGSLQNVRGLTVFPSEYFHPRSSVTGLTQITDRTYSIHQFNWSWVGDKQMEEKLETHKKYQDIVKRMQENENEYKSFHSDANT